MPLRFQQSAPSPDRQRALPRPPRPILTQSGRRQEGCDQESCSVIVVVVNEQRDDCERKVGVLRREMHAHQKELQERLDAVRRANDNLVLVTGQNNTQLASVHRETLARAQWELERVDATLNRLAQDIETELSFNVARATVNAAERTAQATRWLVAVTTILIVATIVTPLIVRW